MGNIPSPPDKVVGGTYQLATPLPGPGPATPTPGPTLPNASVVAAPQAPVPAGNNLSGACTDKATRIQNRVNPPNYGPDSSSPDPCPEVQPQNPNPVLSGVNASMVTDGHIHPHPVFPFGFVQLDGVAGFTGSENGTVTVSNAAQPQANQVWTLEQVYSPTSIGLLGNTQAPVVNTPDANNPNIHWVFTPM